MQNMSSVLCMPLVAHKYKTVIRKDRAEGPYPSEATGVPQGERFGPTVFK